MIKTLRTFTQLALPTFALGLMLSSSALVVAESNVSAHKQLEAAVNSSWRTAENRARDQYRHPLQTLSFFGIKPDATLIEVFPSGKAYYSEILAPFMQAHGQYITVNIAGNPEDAGPKGKFAADPAHYGKIKMLEISPTALDFGAPNSADFLLTFRNVHNFAMNDAQGDFFKAAFKTLKPGGTLGVVDHRAVEGKTFADVKNTGYIPEAFVIAEAEKAGFKLVATSAINNNIKDTKNYPNNVWSLPPTFADGDKDREKYIAIGESDRFTLRFIKPKS